MASRNCSGRRASSAMPGRIPTVETVMCRAPIPRPSGWFRMVSASLTAGQLSSGSPIPMNTTLVGLSAGSRSTISRACATISNALRLRRNPIRPVAQNVHPSAHPAWDETQSVRRAPDGISTDSIASPSSSRQRNFRVPSLDCCTVAAVSRARGNAASSSARSGARQLRRLRPARHRRDPEPPMDLLHAVRRQSRARRQTRRAGRDSRPGEVEKHARKIIRGVGLRTRANRANVTPIHVSACVAGTRRLRLWPWPIVPAG